MLGLCLYASKSTDSVPHGDEVARLGHIRILFGSYFYREIYLGRVVKSKMGASLTTTLTRGGRRVWRVWRIEVLDDAHRRLGHALLLRLPRIPRTGG